MLALLAGAYVYFGNTGGVKTDLPSWVTNIHFSTSTVPVGTTQKNEVTNATKVVSGRIKTTQGVERWYTHEAPRFSFRLPDGFSAPDIDTGTKGVSGVQVSNDTGVELVVYVYPIGSGSQMDLRTIKSYLAGQVISGLEETVLGTAVRGYRFYTTDAEGRMVHLWAAYNGYVYTIQSRVEDEDLFSFITQNWFFAPPTPSNTR